MDIDDLKREVDRCRDLESKGPYPEDAVWYADRANRLERTVIRLEEMAAANAPPGQRR